MHKETSHEQKQCEKLLKCLGNQVHTMMSPWNKWKPPSPVSSRCWTKPTLLKWMQPDKVGLTNKNWALSYKRELINQIDLSMEEDQNRLKSLNMGGAHKQPWELEEWTKLCSHGPPMKIHRCSSSHENLSKITPVTSKSPNTIFSAHKDFQNSQTQSGSKSCRGMQLIWMSSSQGSIRPSPIIEHHKQLETLSSDSGMLSPPSQSGTMESGSSHSTRSNELCGSSSPIVKPSLYGMKSTSLHTSHPLMQWFTTGSST